MNSGCRGKGEVAINKNEAGRHKPKVQANVSREFQRDFEKQTADKPAPKPKHYYNLEGSAPDTELMPTHMAKIRLVIDN